MNKYKPSCSGFVCDNAKLRQFIASKTDAQSAEQYTQHINQIREAAASGDRKSMVMKKEDVSSGAQSQTNVLNNAIVAAVVALAVIVLIWLVRHRRKKMRE